MLYRFDGNMYRYSRKESSSSSRRDSFSFLKALTDQSLGKLPARESIIYHSIEGYFGFRQGELLGLIGLQGSGGWSLPEDKAKELSKMQLYNLKKDPQRKKESE